jgi:site-specific DNA-methyltransferase (adenine-specific)
MHHGVQSNRTDVDKVIRKISLLHSVSAETPTDTKLVEEVVNRLDLNWNDPNLKFYDPACGRGNFLLVLFKKLAQHGHDPAHIVTNMLFGSDISFIQAAIARKALFLVSGAQANIYIEDALLKEETMKFDVVITNPPYQNPGKSRGQKLWYKFVFKCDKLVKPGGYLAMVTPTSWIRGGVNHGKEGVLKDIFAKKQLVIAAFDNITKRFFPKVGIDIGWWIMKNESVHSPTRMILQDCEKQIDLKGVEVMSPVADSRAIGILEKFIDDRHLKEEVIYFNYKNPDLDIESSKATATHPVKHWVHGCSQKKNDTYTYLAERFNDKLNFNKIMFVIGSRYWQPHVDMTGIGVVAQGFAVPIKDTWTRDGILSVYESKLWKLINFNFQLQQNGFMKNAIVRKTPAMDMSKVWTDDEIYKHFNFTQDEIDYIEETVK